MANGNTVPQLYSTTPLELGRASAKHLFADHEVPSFPLPQNSIIDLKFEPDIAPTPLSQSSPPSPPATLTPNSYIPADDINQCTSKYHDRFADPCATQPTGARVQLMTVDEIAISLLFFPRSRYKRITPSESVRGRSQQPIICLSICTRAPRFSRG